MEAAARSFFSYPRFAVAGASQDARKFGYKILAWYDEHSLAVTPINPRASCIRISNTNGSKTYATVPNLAALPAPTETSLSIVTPPPVTRQLLDEAKRLDIPAVWLQPGTFNADILDFAKRNFGAAVAGFDDDPGFEGWCVLVHGEAALAAAGQRLQKA